MLARLGRYQEVADNLRVKEIWLDGRRYVVCHNPQREPEDARRRAEIVTGLQKELAHGGLPKLPTSALILKNTFEKGVFCHIVGTTTS
jgi:calcineurin-like phosphoesterase family protein